MTFSRITAVAWLLLAVGLFAVPDVAGAGQVQGVILGPAGVTPVSGAVVTFASLDSGKRFNALPTGSDGQFVMPRLPAGTFDAAVSTSRGLWLVDQQVLIDAGETRSLSFALREAGQEDPKEWPEGQALPAGEVIGIAELIEQDTKSSLTNPQQRRRILTGVGIGAGILLLAILAGDDSSTAAEASPFTPDGTPDN